MNGIDPDVQLSRTAVKLYLLENHSTIPSTKVVDSFRELYPNTATASSQLSRFKRKLMDRAASDTDFIPPTSSYMSELHLSKPEYTKITTSYYRNRDDQSRDVRVIDNPDLIVQIAQIYLQSGDFRDLWSACIVVSGLRPADIMTVVLSKPEKVHEHPDFWVSISNVAKKKKTNEEPQSFEHPLLAPRWLFIRAIRIIRDYFSPASVIPPLTKEQLSLRYSSYWKHLLETKFSFIGGDITHVLFRRMYAKYAFNLFKSDFLPASITEHGFISFALMHDSNEPALAYGNLTLGPSNGFDVFKAGRLLAVIGKPSDVVKKPRSHSSLSYR